MFPTSSAVKAVCVRERARTFISCTFAFPGREVQHWKRLPREVMESPFLRVFRMELQLT